MRHNVFTAAALALSGYGTGVLRPRSVVVDAPITQHVRRDRWVPGVGRVYQGGSVPGGMRRRRDRRFATYTGPMHAFASAPGGRLRAVPLYGERCMVMPSARAGMVSAQFNNTELLNHAIHDEYVSLGLGWHDLPRNHFRFDEPVRWL